MVGFGAIRNIFVQVDLADRATRGLDIIDKAGSRVVEKFRNIERASLVIGGALTAVGAAGAFFFKGATKEAADFADVSASFRKIVGENADMLLREMDRAAAGTVDSLDLITNANKAMLLGIDAEKLPRMMEIARAAARTTGQSVDFMFESIALGMGRQSRLILDNLGIIVDAEKAYEEYAKTLGKTANQLTEMERKLAFQNAVMKAGQSIIDKTDFSQRSLNEDMQRAAVAFRNFKREIGAGVTPAVSAFANVLGKLTGILEALPSPVKKFIGTGGLLITLFAGVTGAVLLFTTSLIFMSKTIIEAGGITTLYSGVLGVLKTSLLAVAGAARAFAISTLAAMAPIAPFIIGLGALALIFQDLWTGMRGGESTILSFIGWLDKTYNITVTLRNAFDAIKSTVLGFIDALRRAYDLLSPIFKLMSFAFTPTLALTKIPQVTSSIPRPASSVSTTMQKTANISVNIKGRADEDTVYKATKRALLEWDMAFQS
jgi:hypothetical protein